MPPDLQQPGGAALAPNGADAHHQSGLAHPSSAPGVGRPALTRGLLLTMAVASAAAVANLSYNQPMLADMMQTFDTTPDTIGLVTTIAQVGYALGMLVFIPLGDLVERRRPVVLLFVAAAIALFGEAVA